MRSIRHKLPLLHPRRLYRPYRPSGKQDADAEKYEEAKRADEAAGAEQSVQRRAFTGDIREHETMVQRHIRAVISQVIFLNDACLLYTSYHWVRIQAGDKKRYAVVLEDRSKIVSLSAGDAIAACMAQAPHVDTSELEKKLADMTAEKNAVEKRLADVKAYVAEV